MTTAPPADYHLQNGCWNCQRCFRPWSPECFEGYCAADCGVRHAMRLHRAYMDAMALKGYPHATPNGAWSHEDLEKVMAWEEQMMQPFEEWEQDRSVDETGICSRWRQSQARGMQRKR